MKILSIFIDMLSPKVLDFDNRKNYFSTEDFLKNLGGTLYKNTFTSGADTSRSLSEFWSSIPCYKNGCNRRARYPKYFLEKQDFLSILRKNNYSINLFANQKMSNVGIYPKEAYDYANLNKDFRIDEFLKNVVEMNDENSFTFVTIDDFHWGLDDYGPGKRGITKSLILVGEVLKRIVESVNLEYFDLILIFSDHGFLSYKDMKCGLFKMLLSDNRCNILSFIHRKNDTEIKVSNKFCSISDFGVFILEQCGLKYDGSVYGISFLSEKEHDYIVNEDFYLLRSSLHMHVDLWGVRTKDSCVAFEFGKEPLFSGKKKITNYQEILEKECIDFVSTKKCFDVMTYYNELKNTDSSFYTSGSKRHKFSKNAKINSAFKRLYNLSFFNKVQFKKRRDDK